LSIHFIIAEHMTMLCNFDAYDVDHERHPVGTAIRTVPSTLYRSISDNIGHRYLKGLDTRRRHRPAPIITTLLRRNWTWHRARARNWRCGGKRAGLGSRR
jgi:hypothetical protein